MVSPMVRLKYSLNSQKPGSLTWEKITLPEPTAITISSGLTPVVAISGAAIPPAVMAATVAEPSAIRSTAAIDHAINSGDMFDSCMIEAMYLSMPLSTSTCLKAPPPPIINSIMAMILIEEVRVSLICSMERPRFKPKVNRAISTAIRVAITGSPKNSAIGRKAWPFGRIISATARIAIRITGTSEVQTLTPKPRHLFFSEHFRVMQAFRDRLIYPFQEARKHRSRRG